MFDFFVEHVLPIFIMILMTCMLVLLVWGTKELITKGICDSCECTTIRTREN